MNDKPEGSNQPFTPQAEVASESEAINELKAQLETEQQARVAFEAEIARHEATLSEKDTRITELERIASEAKQTLSTREAEVNSLKLSVEDTIAKHTTLNQSLQDAISAYKAIVTKANPGIPEQLITGDTIEAIAQSLENAKSLVSKVRTSIEAEIASGKVPTGAPARTAPDLSALSPREKIQYAITKGGKKKWL